MPDALLQLLPLVVLVAIAYLLFIRPARKRAREVQTLQAALSAGDEIMLTSGIFARVVSIEELKVQVEVAPGVVVTVHRGAVEKLLHDEPAPAAYDPEVEPAEGASVDDTRKEN